MTTVDPGLVAGITAPYRVRFDECGPDGLARTAALLRYAQDVAWIHSERMGFDRAWYADRGLAWVVRAVELEIRLPVTLGATLEVSTAVVGFRKVWARRRTEARDPDGRLVAWAHTDWVMTHARGMPARVPPEFPARFAAPPGAFVPGRVPLPPTPAAATALRTAVRPQDVDPMGHVNNAAYVDYLEEALLAIGGEAAASVTAMPRNLRLEYLVPAAPGTVLVGQAWPMSTSPDAAPDEAGMGGRGWAYRLVDDQDHELARGRLSTVPPGG